MNESPKAVLQFVGVVAVISVAIFIWRNSELKNYTINLPKSTKQMCADVAKETKQRVWYSPSADKCAIMSGGGMVGFDPHSVRPAPPQTQPNNMPAEAPSVVSSSSPNNENSDEYKEAYKCAMESLKGDYEPGPSAYCLGNSRDASETEVKAYEAAERDFSNAPATATANSFAIGGNTDYEHACLATWDSMISDKSKIGLLAMLHARCECSERRLTAEERNFFIFLFDVGHLSKSDPRVEEAGKIMRTSSFQNNLLHFENASKRVGIECDAEM